MSQKVPTCRHERLGRPNRAPHPQARGPERRRETGPSDVHTSTAGVGRRHAWELGGGGGDVSDGALLQVDGSGASGRRSRAEGVCASRGGHRPAPPRVRVRAQGLWRPARGDTRPRPESGPRLSLRPPADCERVRHRPAGRGGGREDSARHGKARTGQAPRQEDRGQRRHDTAVKQPALRGPERRCSRARTGPGCRRRASRSRRVP
uniref:Uncharacterized protein n=1 Tax=Emiliania huxleyi (strain CCMP1516) TaxID=280463 RepID=A0A0D3JHI2_EMIH1